MRESKRSLVLVVTLLLLIGSAASGQTPCPRPYMEDLEQPQVVRAVDGVLQVSFEATTAPRDCVPTVVDTGQKDQNGDKILEIKNTTMTLRAYHVNGAAKASIPGPTLRLRKEMLQDATKPKGSGNPQVRPGDRLKLDLTNSMSLPPLDKYTGNKQCEPVNYCSAQSDPWIPCGSYTNWQGATVDLGSCSAQNTCGSNGKCTLDGSDCSSKPCNANQCGGPKNLEFPECFHGGEVTNLHYHGTHVSPQPHQDFVLLNLFADNDPSFPTCAPGSFCDLTNQKGSYQTDIHALPWNQAPGTHWYHPHKHGSTSIQVLNGMAGALIIDGPFDDWLYDYYGVDASDQKKLEEFEKVLVVSQIIEDLNFFKSGASSAQALVNGQANPVIHMQAGETQRWRLVGATMQATASLQIGFEGPKGAPSPTLHQIAQDGVQFAWQNYDRQPYEGPGGSFSNYKIAPGTRADFLVVAPSEVGVYTLTQVVDRETLNAAHPNVQSWVRSFESTTQALLSDTETVQRNIEQSLAEAGESRDVQRSYRRSTATTTAQPVTVTNPPLLTVVVTGPAVKAPPLPTTRATDRACAGASPPKRCWPETPAYLQDLGTPDRVRTVAYSMTDPETGLGSTPGDSENGFWIDGKQYDMDCGDQQMVLESTEDWIVSNNSSPTHPFHIHINPFQVLRNPSYTAIGDNGPPYPWQDTIPLPKVTCTDVKAGPIGSQQQASAVCPGTCSQHNDGRTPPGIYSWNAQWRTTVPGQQSVCGCCIGPAEESVHIRNYFADYSGAYVQHCHFLGHEDRGMMQNVQTVCKDTGKFGTPDPSGGPDNCGAPSSFTPNPLPLCRPYDTATGFSSGGQQP